MSNTFAHKPFKFQDTSNWSVDDWRKNLPKYKSGWNKDKKRNSEKMVMRSITRDSDLYYNEPFDFRIWVDF